MSISSLTSLRIALVLGLLSMGSPAAAEGEKPAAIDISELPKPAAEIDQLLKRADVSFAWGPVDREADAASGGKLAAETRYRIGYRYRNRTRWNVTNRGGKRSLVITVRFSDIRLSPTHEVWFRRRPQTDGFWQDRLVLHELDHVKISSDPRLARRFAELLRESNVVQHELLVGEMVNAELVNRLVEEHVETVFEKISELAAIRYRELDQLTRHGMQPLPESSPLAELLLPAADSQ